MDLNERDRSLVDQGVRAFVYSLVTALGGTGGDDGRYVLGDDALACLRDIKRWLNLFDNKLDRLDVARCLAEANVVKGDLLEILAASPNDLTESHLRYKIAVACLELLVHLTWHIHKDDQHMTINHHNHLPYLQLAQVEYKRGILHHDTAQILQTIVRIGLPCMALTKNERSPRDEGIINLVSHFLCNVARIAHPLELPALSDENDVDRSATIEGFHYQSAFAFLLTIASNIGDDFPSQDVIVLETIYHLVKGVDVERLFMEKDELVTSNTKAFKDLLYKEKAMLAGQARSKPSRHGRFGTMLWLKRDGEKFSTIGGQDGVMREKNLEKMDKSKKWERHKHTSKNAQEAARNDFATTTPLTASARRHLRTFVEDFLDSSYNPLFTHVRKAIEREANRVQDSHRRQYYYLISWFLQAERARRRKQKAELTSRKAAVPDDVASFALIAGVMNQETFVLLYRYLQESEDNKRWNDLNAGLRCFIQILLTVQEMAESPLEEDQEIAENTQNRIFYEQTTHDRVVAIVRNYKDQGAGYLDACTELAHVFVRMLEKYSKQNVDLQVRTRRRTRRKKVAERKANGEDVHEDGEQQPEQDVAAAQKTSSERKFDFTRFVARFMNQGCIDTFVAFTRLYNDLNAEQLKRAHRFFYRTCFKMECSVLLMRMDIVALFHKMLRGIEAMEPGNAAYKEWEELVRQIFRRVVKKMEERPGIAIEMLFSKIPATLFYLEHGYDKQLPTKIPRRPAELEVKPGMDWEKQVGVAVSVMIDQGKSDVLRWVKEILESAAGERQSWEDQATASRAAASERGILESIEHADNTTPNSINVEAPSIVVRPDTPARQAALFRDNKLRLLLSLLSFRCVGDAEDPTASWIIPSSLSAGALKEYAGLISKIEFEPPTYEDGYRAEDLLRRKAVVAMSREAAIDSDQSEGGSGDDEDLLFPPNPRAAKQPEAGSGLKRKRRELRRSNADVELENGELDRRREQRKAAESEKRKKIKSAMYVVDSDRSDDEAFFAREEELRKKTGHNIVKAIRAVTDQENGGVTRGKKRKARNGVEIGDTHGEETDSEPELEQKKQSRTRRKGEVEVETQSVRRRGRTESSDSDPDTAEAENDQMDTETPLSSQPVEERSEEASIDMMSTGKKASGLPSRAKALGEEQESEDDDVVVARSARRKTQAGFLVDSDDE